MRDFLRYPPVLGFLFAFNLAIAVAAGFEFDGAKQLVICIGTGLVSVAAAAGVLLQYRSRRADLAAPEAVAA